MKKAFQDVKKPMLRQTVKRYTHVKYEEPGTGNRVSRIEPFYFGLDGNRMEVMLRGELRSNIIPSSFTDKDILFMP
jgi:hypothetical protein